MAAMQFVHYTGVATMSSLAQLQVQHAKEQGQCKNEADQEWRSKKITCDTYRAANWLKMVARREREWIGMFRKAWLVFRYEYPLYQRYYIN